MSHHCNVSLRGVWLSTDRCIINNQSIINAVQRKPQYHRVSILISVITTHNNKSEIIHSFHSTVKAKSGVGLGVDGIVSIKVVQQLTGLKVACASGLAASQGHRGHILTRVHCSQNTKILGGRPSGIHNICLFSVFCLHGFTRMERAAAVACNNSTLRMRTTQRQTLPTQESVSLLLSPYPRKERLE